VTHLAGVGAKLDKHPVATSLALVGVLFFGLLIWAWRDPNPVLLGRAAIDHRTDIYSQFASTAVALLAVALTVLSILVALPDQPRVRELRDRSGWRLLQNVLLAASFLCLVTTVAAHVGTGVDRGKPLEWLEQLTVAAGIGSILTVAVAGAAFAMLLRATTQPADPSIGRGEGARI
jgi:hypothetical protein